MASLEDLQRAYRGGARDAVMAALVGPDVEVPPAPPVAAPPVARASNGWTAADVYAAAADLDSGWAMRCPTDWPYRTSWDDVRREAVDLIEERFPQWPRDLVWDVVLGAKCEDVPSRTVDLVRETFSRVAQQVLATVPRSPGRKPTKPKRMPARVGEAAERLSSPVVTRRADGTYVVGGQVVDAVRAAEVLGWTGGLERHAGDAAG